MNIDDVDREILEFLHAQPRSTNKAVAGKVGISEATVANRIRRMVSGGVLRFTLQRNAEQQGFRFSAIVFVTVNGRGAEQVAAELTRVDQVLLVALMEGDADILVLLHCRDHDDADRLINRAIARIPGVHTLEFDVTLKIVKSNNRLTRRALEYLA